MNLDPNAPASTMTVRAELAARFHTVMLAQKLDEQVLSTMAKDLGLKTTTVQELFAKVSTIHADALIAELNKP